MKKRYKKKRKQQQYIEGLERGNQYLADAVGRLMEEKMMVSDALAQIESIYQGYLTTIIKDLETGIKINREHMKEVMENAKLSCWADDENIYMGVVEKEQA